MADDVDWGVASKIKPVEADFTKTLNAYSNYTLSTAHAGLFDLEAQKERKRQQGLTDYGAALDRGETPETAVRHLMRTDPELGIKTLEGHQKSREMQAQQNYVKSGDPRDLRVNPQMERIGGEEQTRRFDLGHEAMSRRAHAILGEKDPMRRQQLWSDTADQALKENWITPEQHKKYRDLPVDSLEAQTTLNNIIRSYMDVKTNRETTGAQAGAAAAGAAPYHPMGIRPDERVIFPGARPGSPTAPAAQPGSIPIAPQGGISIGPRGEELLTQPGPQQPPNLGTQPNTTPADGKKANQGLPYYNEIKPMHVAPQVSTGPGVVEPGTHPLAAEATKEAQKTFKEDIQPSVNTAAKTQAELGNLLSELDSGKVSTSRIADMQLTVGGYIYGVMKGVMGEDAAQKLALQTTGSNLPWNELFQKDATKMGLTFARQTEGAREAVMAIRIALGANPSLLNTAEGNKLIINLMMRGAEYDMERGKAATAYFQRQHDDTGTGHLIGFDQWWTGSHAPAQFMSQAVPYPIPRLQDGSFARGKLQDGVTYEWPVRDPTSRQPAVDAKTKKPVTQRGIWNSRQGGFTPVEQ